MGRQGTGMGRIGWLGASVGVPSIVAGVWRDLVAEHLLVAIFFVIGYELLLGVLRFTSKIWKELVKRWQARSVRLIDQMLARRFSRFDRRYREFVLSSTRFVDLKGLKTIGPRSPDLHEVFLDLSLSARAPHQISPSVLADLDTEAEELQSIEDFLEQANTTILAVIGGPGSGKTTLLRHAAHEICANSRGGMVPLLLYLRDHAGVITSTPQVSLLELMSSVVQRRGLQEPVGWFEQRLHRGECVVLLDGLDEVAAQKDRRCVADWIEQQVRRYPKNTYLVTARPHGYHLTPISGATVVQVQRFTKEQTTQFIHKWYWAVEKHSDTTDVTALADDLCERLRSTPSLYDLAVNPLLLTMIVNVHRYRGALPGSRIDLYREICQVMLWQRREALNLPIVLRGDQQETLLHSVAFTMMRKRVYDLSRTDILTAIAGALRRVSTMVNAETFLADLETNGLLVGRETDLYAFAHPSLQECLAAMHLRENHETKLSDLLDETVDDIWWRETLLFCAAGSDADPIVRACLSSGTIAALTLAFDCAEQASELAPELRHRLEALLSEEHDTNDPERRALVAGLAIARHLRHTVRVAGNSQICARPITARTYEMFCQEMLIQGKDYTPDGPRTIGNETVTGIRASDAVAFVHWVNDLFGGVSLCRLPTLAEMNDLAVHSAGTRMTQGAWINISQNGDSPELWIPQGIDHPQIVHSSTIAPYLDSDIKQSQTTFAELLLIRYISVLFALNHALDRELTSAFTLARVRDLTHGLPVIGALDTELTRTIDQARQNVTRLRNDVDGVRAINRARSLDRSRARDQASTRNPGRARILADTRARELHSAIDRAQALADHLNQALSEARPRHLSGDLDHALALDRARASVTHHRSSALGNAKGSTLAHALGRDLERFMGSGMAQALSLALEKARDAEPDHCCETFLTALSQIFASNAPQTITVSPDDLITKIQTAQTSLLNLLDEADERPSSPWAREVVTRLKNVAVPVVSRRQELTPSKATAIRLAAWCLAAEVDAHPNHAELSETFREIIAGITLLQTRRVGKSPPAETILLTINQ